MTFKLSLYKQEHAKLDARYPDLNDADLQRWAELTDYLDAQSRLDELDAELRAK